MTHRIGIVSIALAAIVGCALWLGCGVKSPPIPPEEAIPERIADLYAASAKRGVRLSWERPDRYAGGHRMRDLGRFKVYRAEGKGTSFLPLADIPVSDQERFQQQRRFTYVDSDTQLGHLYRYEVFSETEDGYRSRASNEAELVWETPKPAPNPENFVLPAPTPLP